MCEFVRVAIDEALAEEAMELPAEDDGSLLLDSLKSQFEGATGLKYRNSETGGWRGVRLSEGVLHPPHGLWGDGLYVVVMPHVKVPQDSKEHSSGEGWNECVLRLGFKSYRLFCIGGVCWVK